MTAHMRLARPLVSSIRKALTRNALPEETEGLTASTEQEAAEFLASVGAQRKKGEVAIAIESTGGEAGRRRMRIGIVNDDMPFLVDSVANAIARQRDHTHDGSGDDVARELARRVSLAKDGNELGLVGTLFCRRDHRGKGRGCSYHQTLR